jgi:hypothetical protein
MSQVASTMPEAKFRSTKKREKPVASIRSSEFAHEVKAAKPAKQAAKAVAKKREEESSFKIASLWPIAVGILLAGFAPEWQVMATQAGIWPLRLAFPFALLATHREIGIDAQMAVVLPQIALYAQLPIDGLMMVVAMARSKSLKTAIEQLVLVHLVCAFVLWLLTYLN